MKALANPVLLRAAVVFLCSSFAFLLALIFMRLLRKSITEDAEISSEAHPALEAFPVHVYNTVIQQLKQQKYELQAQSQAEQQRARTTETLSQAVLSNLSCGVLVFGTNGLVKTSNPAAKQILGFASTTGMSAENIFRGAMVSGTSSTESVGDASLADEVSSVLREGSTRREVQGEYETPAGESRYIAVTISPVPARDGSLLGVTCLISDISELEHIRRDQELQGELSAEMALQMRTSLLTISSYTQQLAEVAETSATRQLANDLANEAASLNRNISSLLTHKSFAQGAAAASGSAD